jgi:DNA-binding PadR family transcriptional regulator
VPSTPAFRRSPLALAVLALLESGPLHPYGIQRLVKQWGKDQVVNVTDRTSLYRMITRLETAGLIEVADTERSESYPERTLYRLTEDGAAVSHLWLAEIISTPRNEFPEFPVGLSFLMLLPPGDTEQLLEQRRGRLAQHLAELDAGLATEGEGYGIPRIALIDSEYQRTIVHAELHWVTSVLTALRDGSFTWNREELEAMATASRTDQALS